MLGLNVNRADAFLTIPYEYKLTWIMMYMTNICTPSHEFSYHFEARIRDIGDSPHRSSSLHKRLCALKDAVSDEKSDDGLRGKPYDCALGGVDNSGAKGYEIIQICDHAANHLSVL